MNSFAKNRLFSICLLAGLASLIAPPAAHATEATLTGDAHVTSAHNTTNFGTLSNLYVGGGYITLLQFDLTTLPAGTTSSSIARATLTVFVNRVNTGGPVSLSPVTSPWSESAVTFATLPSVGTTSSSFTAAAAGTYATLDVTALVQGWITTPASNFGLAFTAPVANLLLDSKENDETGHAAKLDITLTTTGATGPQGPQGIQGLVGPQGIQGVAGPAGIPGAVGPIGPMGPIGLTGVAGAVGSIGPAGPIGTPGVAGAVGPAGSLGPVGPAGPQGLIGPQGPIGPIGPSGGPAGPTGAVGPAGPTGTVAYQRVYDTTATYAQNDVVSDSNHFNTYISLLGSNTGNALPASGGINTYWATLAAQGAQGVAGANGTGTGTVTSVTAGTITNTAAQGGGTLTVNTTTTTPTIDVNFPKYTLPTALAGINTLFTNGDQGTGSNIFISSTICTLGDMILSTNGYGDGSYLPADGRILPIAQYTAVFSIMGINFGGNGTSNFALPNLTAFAPPGLYWSVCVSGYFPSRY